LLGGQKKVSVLSACNVNEMLGKPPDKVINKKTEISLTIFLPVEDLISSMNEGFENDTIEPSDLIEIVIEGINPVNIKLSYNDFLQKIMIISGYIGSQSLKEKTIITYDFRDLHAISDKFFGFMRPCINNNIHIKIIATQPVLETAIIKFKSKFANLVTGNLIIFQIV
jgi:hypothetical protein